jgi:glycosyltransferase involved in cell wall biosynthesis
MRIGWFTPYSRQSAIGEVSQHVVSELAGRAEVELWITGGDDPREATVPVFDLDDGPPTDEQLHGYDWCVYHYGVHAAIHNVAIRRPGIVVLHDRVLQNLFSGMWIARDRDPARYVERMGAWYGEPGRRVAVDAMIGRGGRPWDNVEDNLRFPLWEEAMIGAVGVLTHADSHAEHIRREWGGPVRRAGLPTYPSDWVDQPDPPAMPNGRLQLLTVGHVNPNKRVLEVVRALARNADMADLVRYTIVGSFHPDSAYVAEIRAEITRHGLDDCVELLGWRDDGELNRLMGQADVFVNLRWPTLEGSSASLVRQLPWGKPIVTFDSGFFGELPPGAVVKIPPQDYDGLAADLRTLVQDAALRDRIGAAGREAARSMTVAAYAEALLLLIDDAERWAPMSNLCDRVADEIALLGADARLPVVDIVADQVAQMFPDGG